MKLFNIISCLIKAERTEIKMMALVVIQHRKRKWLIEIEEFSLNKKLSC
jgi:hypothetical protein